VADGLGREINPPVLTVAEFRRRRTVKLSLIHI